MNRTHFGRCVRVEAAAARWTRSRRTGDDDDAIGVDASSREVQARSGDRHLEHGERSRDGTRRKRPRRSPGAGCARSRTSRATSRRTCAYRWTSPSAYARLCARSRRHRRARARARPVGRDLPRIGERRDARPRGVAPRAEADARERFARVRDPREGPRGASRRAAPATGGDQAVDRGGRSQAQDVRERREDERVRGARGVSRPPFATTAARKALACNNLGAEDGSAVETIHAVNAALAARGHAPFYDDPDPHVSVLWAPLEDAERLSVVEAAARDASQGTETSASPGTSAGTRFRFETRVDKVVCVACRGSQRPPSGDGRVRCRRPPRQTRRRGSGNRARRRRRIY